MTESIVTCCAILGGLPLAVTGQTGAHVMRNRAFGDRALSDISMTRRTGNASAVVRRVPELYVCIL